MVLAEEGNFVQSTLLREAAIALDAAARSTLSTTTAPLRRLPSLPAPPAPLAPFLAPLTLPYDLLKATLELQQVHAARWPRALC